MYRGLFKKVILRESTEPKLNTRVLWILFLHHSVTKVSSIDIFFFRNDGRTKLCTNIASYQVYIRSIKIFILQFSIKYTINTNPVCHGVTKSTKSIFVLEQLKNVKQIKTSIKIVQTQEFKIRKWCTQAKADACHVTKNIVSMSPCFVSLKISK